MSNHFRYIVHIVLPLLSGACGARASDARWYLALSDSTRMLGASTVMAPGLTLRKIGEINIDDLERPGAPMIVSSSGLLAVRDGDGCRIHLIQLPAGRRVRTLQSCRASLSGAVFTGDTLLLFDGRSHQFVFVGDTGAEIERRPAPTSLSTRIVNSLSVWNDGLMVGDLDLPTSSPQGRVGIMERTTGQLAAQLVPDVPASRDNPKSESMQHRVCAVTWQNEPYFVVAQSWRFEVALFHRAGDPVWSLRVPLDWMTEFQAPGRPEGARWPSGTVRNPVCGDFGVFARYAHIEPMFERSSRYEDGGRVEIVDPAGVRRLSVDVPGGYPYLFQPAVSWGNLLVFQDARTRPFRLQVFELRTTSTISRRVNDVILDN